jgi:hypothetical protein
MAALVALQYKNVMDIVTTFCRKDDQRLLVYFYIGLGCDTPILEALFITCLARVLVQPDIGVPYTRFGLRLFELFYLSLHHRAKRVPEERAPWREVFLLDDSKIILAATVIDNMPTLYLRKSIESSVILQYEIFIAGDGALLATQYFDGCYFARELHLSDKLLVDFPNNKQWK